MQEENKGKNEFVKIRFDSKEELMDHICNVEKDEKQAEAMRLIFDESSKKHVFITGIAGTGKTTFIKRIRRFLPNYALLTNNDISALNIKGFTIRDFFSLKILAYHPKFKDGKFDNHTTVYLNKTERKVVKRLKFILIDDVSSVRADLLDKIAEILRIIRESDEPFGGVRMIFVGDLFQMPPTTNQKDPTLKDYDTIYFFSSKALMLSGFNVVTFDKVYRQKDEKFVNILSEIWNGGLSDESLFLLNSTGENENLPYKPIEIYSDGRDSYSINQCQIFNEKSKPVILYSREFGSIPEDVPFERPLCLKIGSRVVLTKGDEHHNAGDTGTVEKVSGHVFDPEIIGVYVIFDGEDKSSFIFKEYWYKAECVNKGSRIRLNYIGKAEQYPLKIGYAISVYRLYGMEFNSAYLYMSRSFEPWKLYLALSRCKYLDRICLKTKLTKDDVKFDDNIYRFYNDVKNNNGVFEPIPISELEPK